MLFGASGIVSSLRTVCLSVCLKPQLDEPNSLRMKGLRCVYVCVWHVHTAAAPKVRVCVLQWSLMAPFVVVRLLQLQAGQHR